MLNYSQICADLIKNLSPSQRKVIVGRFGLNKGTKRETLEAIGKTMGVTRERVRQIERDAILKIKPKISEYQEVFREFSKNLELTGLRKEDVFLNVFGGSKNQAPVFFLLNLSADFIRFPEKDDYHSFWTTQPEIPDIFNKTMESFYQELNRVQKTLTSADFQKISPELSLEKLAAFLEASKKINQGQDGVFGMKNWPEINPRGVRDKAYLMLKKEQKPLHFDRIAGLIDGAVVQTVHNELIKDPKFVLVGRGIYGLAEWGYKPGQVKDVISETLKQAGKPLTKEELLEKVLSQRLVKESTILLNLGNRKNFFKNPEGKYWFNSSSKINPVRNEVSNGVKEI